MMIPIDWVAVAQAFKTRDNAEDYVKELAETQGLRVHVSIFCDHRGSMRHQERVFLDYKKTRRNSTEKYFDLSESSIAEAIHEGVEGLQIKIEGRKKKWGSRGD